MLTRRRLRSARARVAITQNHVTVKKKQTRNTIPTCEDKTRFANEAPFKNNMNENKQRERFVLTHKKKMKQKKKKKKKKKNEC